MTTFWRAIRMAAIAIAMLAAPASAQRALGPRLGLSQPAVRGERPFEQPFARDSVLPSQWKKGMIIGGVVGAAVGVAVNSFEKSMSDDPYRRFSYAALFLSMFIFAVVGGLIGSGIHKNQ